MPSARLPSVVIVPTYFKKTTLFFSCLLKSFIWKADMFWPIAGSVWIRIVDYKTCDSLALRRMFHVSVETKVSGLVIFLPRAVLCSLLRIDCTMVIHLFVPLFVSWKPFWYFYIGSIDKSGSHIYWLGTWIDKTSHTISRRQTVGATLSAGVLLGDSSR